MKHKLKNSNWWRLTCWLFTQRDRGFELTTNPDSGRMEDLNQFVTFLMETNRRSERFQALALFPREYVKGLRLECLCGRNVLHIDVYIALRGDVDGMSLSHVIFVFDTSIMVR